MKKLTAVLLTALLAAGLIACGSSAPAKETAGEASKAAETEKSAENAAADTKNQHIITPVIIEELSKDINEGRATKGGYNWGKYWNDIVKIIDAWEEET